MYLISKNKPIINNDSGGDSYNPGKSVPRMKELGCISTVNNGSTYTVENFLDRYGILDGSFNGMEIGDIIRIQHPAYTFYNGISTQTYNDTFWFVADFMYFANYYYNIALFPLQTIYGNMGTSSESNKKESVVYYDTYTYKTAIPNLSTVMNYTLKNYLRTFKRNIPYNISTAINSNLGAGLKGAVTAYMGTYVNIDVATSLEITGSELYSSSFYNDYQPHWKFTNPQLSLFKYYNYNLIHKRSSAFLHSKGIYGVNAASQFMTRTITQANSSTSVYYLWYDSDNTPQYSMGGNLGGTRKSVPLIMNLASTSSIS